MRAHLLSLVGAGAVALVAASGFISPASAGHRPTASSYGSEASHAARPSNASASCYVQGSANGLGLVSQNFEAAFDAFDSRGADDFLLHSKCAVRNVTVKGDYFNGSGPADSINIVIYADGGGLPGAIIKQFADMGYTDPSGSGNFSVTLPKTVLQTGLYWISVRPNMAFSPNGEWEWSTNYNLHNNVPVWRNPGDGFGTGCITYQSVFNCGFDDEDGGQSFSFTIS
jgi:hypothetical protein